MQALRKVTLGMRSFKQERGSRFGVRQRGLSLEADSACCCFGLAFGLLKAAGIRRDCHQLQGRFSFLISSHYECLHVKYF